MGLLALLVAYALGRVHGRNHDPYAPIDDDSEW